MDCRVFGFDISPLTTYFISLRIVWIRQSLIHQNGVYNKKENLLLLQIVNMNVIISRKTKFRRVSSQVVDVVVVVIIIISCCWKLHFCTEKYFSHIFFYNVL